jgi:DNA repair photolyase
MTFCVVLVVIVRITALGQTDQPQSTIVSVNTMASAVEKLQNSVEPKTSEISERLVQIRKHLEAIQEAVRVRPVMLGEEPRRYRENLVAISRSLVRLSENVPSTNTLGLKLNAIEQDLALKEKFIGSTRGEPLSQIETVVHTEGKDTHEKSGYEVWYVPKGLEDYKAEYRRFDNLSTPAVMSLPPGNYVLWATKENVISDRRPLTLGDDGRSKREFTLVVK